MAFPCFNSIADAIRSERESREMEREAAIEARAAELEGALYREYLASGYESEDAREAAAEDAWTQAEREIDARDPLDDLNF